MLNLLSRYRTQIACLCWSVYVLVVLGYFASGNQLLVIINDILDLSNIESGAMKLETSAVPVREVLSQLFESFRLMVLKKELKFNINVSDDMPAEVMTDAMHLRKIFSHLIDNAINFTRQGEINVWVHAEQVGATLGRGHSSDQSTRCWVRI